MDVLTEDVSNLRLGASSIPHGHIFQHIRNQDDTTVHVGDHITHYHGVYRYTFSMRNAG